MTGVGAGILLKRITYSMIYIDRDMNRWQSPGNARQYLLVTSGWGSGSFSVLPDVTNGAPSIHTAFTGAWAIKQLAEAWYDAGPDNSIGRIRGTYTAGPNMNASGDANWQSFTQIGNSDTSLTFTSSDVATSAAGTGVTFELIATGTNRFALVQHLYQVAGGAEGTEYGSDWTNLRVIGNHGLPIATTSSGTDGIRCSDIAAHAAAQVGVRVGRIDSSNFVTPQSAYYDPTVPEQVVDDMARLLGWHWGVWEGTSVFDIDPRFFFTAPPTSPNVSVDFTDCEAFDLTERFSQLHDSAVLMWADASGHSGTVTITKKNDRLPYGVHQELLLQSGTMKQTDAEALAATQLAVDQLDSQFAGSAILPRVTDTAIGKRFSHLLKAGRDRIQVLGLPQNTSQLGEPLERVDAFRISRVSVTVGDDGPQTTIDFDTGASLLDTLNARQELVQTLAG